MKVFLTRIMLLSVALTLTACLSERAEREVTQLPASPGISPAVTPTGIASPPASPAVTASTPSPSPSVVASPMPHGSSPSLVIPVVGVRGDQLHDTFNEARSEGRVHEAIDIIAPPGANVVAAADGIIARLFTSDKGGLTIYQLSADQQHVFYYAHLDRYADGLTEKQPVRQGDLIGYVGDTGNAQPGNYHLHFAVWQIANPKDFWTGTNLNPYELLRYAPAGR